MRGLLPGRQVDRGIGGVLGPGLGFAPPPSRFGPLNGAGRWNHNFHYHSWLLRTVPAHCSRVIDLGCGEGTLARALAVRAESVVGIDIDGPSIDLARAQTDDARVEFLCGDAMTYPFDEASFDLVVAVASLHHVGLEAGLRRMRQLVRPGGTVAVIGLARSDGPVDAAMDVMSWVAARAFAVGRRTWESPSPTVWPPAESYRQARAIVQRVLPGASYRCRLLWRYTVAWTAPG